MPTCPNCGAEVTEEMDFCPKCGTALKGEAAEKRRDMEEWGKEFGEKMAKRGKEIGDRISERAKRAEAEGRFEKEEKGEKHEKQEISFMPPLVGGLVLIFLGFMFYLLIQGNLRSEVAGALFFVIIGIVIIIGGIAGVMMARKRHPMP